MCQQLFSVRTKGDNYDINHLTIQRSNRFIYNSSRLTTKYHGLSKFFDEMMMISASTNLIPGG
jgi:hypothetical protein